MPYTPAQRRLFHEVAENPEAAERHGISEKEGTKLAGEADRLAREGKEKTAKSGFVDLSRAFGAPDWRSDEG